MTTTTTTVQAQEAKLPAWFESYIETWQAGAAHAYIVTGDVHGYSATGRTQKETLEELLAQKREVVVTYNPARGFSFGPPAIEPAARAKAAAIVKVAPSAEKSAMSNALSGLGRSSAPSANNDPFDGEMSTLDALKLIESLVIKGSEIKEKNGRKYVEGRVAVIIESAELICGANEKSTMGAQDKQILGLLFSWGTNKKIERSNNPIFLMCKQLSELHPDLRSSDSGMRVLEIDLPNRDERLAYIQMYLRQRSRDSRPIPLVDVTEEEFASTTAGLNRRHIQDIALMGYKAGGITRQIITARSAAIIAAEFSEIAEKIPLLEGGLKALGGQEHLIEWMTNEIVLPIRKGRRNVSKGNLLVGPPGTGKTYSLGALAWELGINAVMLRSENILSKYVGDSEAKLKRFFAFVKALAPCICFFDELDQSDMSSRGSEGNPVGKNLFNQMLQFMSSDTPGVIFFFASNRPDKIDSALLRSGRMDAIIPVLLPNEESRKGILRAQAKTQQIAISEEAVIVGANLSEKYSAADLAAVVTKSAKLARREDREEISGEDAQRAISLLRPNTPKIADYYTMLALRSCNDMELIPPGYEDFLDDPSSQNAKIEEAAAEAGFSSERGERSW